ncbi:MAG: alcohol dehydrogenase catalytic domain-containing protein [Candidatus Rokubacteria bacterium]|nr:alcohol dehydrogenase catalytic domain-containing protein [Candidatus Rokubacteria bacterium]
MRAAVLHAPRALRVESIPAPRPGADEVVVRVAAIGLCGTDHRIWNGDRPVRYPLVMGHEMLGVVQAVGEAVGNLREGERVAVEPNYSCGACPLCREGNRNLCLSRVTLGIDVHGGCAELVRAPARCCWPAPVALTDDQLLLVEPLAVVVRAVGRAAPRAGESAAVVGMGTLGLLAIQVLKARGLRVLAVGRSPRRVALAEELGADAVASAAAGAPSAEAQRFSRREGVDLVIETAGTADAVGQAAALARPGGRVVLTGLPHAPSSVDFFSVVRREITLVGSMIYQDEFPRAVELLATGAVNGARLLTHRFPLAGIEDAFHAHRSPEAIKVAVHP